MKAPKHSIQFAFLTISDNSPVTLPAFDETTDMMTVGGTTAVMISHRESVGLGTQDGTEESKF